MVGTTKQIETSLILFGESQSGKTSVACSITNQQSGEGIGNGDGESVTTKPHVFCGTLNNNGVENRLFCMDTPGRLDTRALFRDNEILEVIEYSITKLFDHISCINAIIIVESLSNDTSQLNRNLTEVTKHFGEEARKSVIVLATKPNLATKINGDKRLVALQKLCGNLNLPMCVYESHDENGNICHDSQGLDTILQVIQTGQIQPYELKKIEETRIAIRKRAKELKDLAPIEYVDQTISVTTQRVQNYTVPYYVDEQQKCGETFKWLTCVIDLDGNELYHLKQNWGYGIQWGRSRWGWHIHSHHPPPGDQVESPWARNPQTIIDDARPFIASKVGVNAEDIGDITFPGRGIGDDLVAGYPRHRKVWRQYRFIYQRKVKDGDLYKTVRVKKYRKESRTVDETEDRVIKVEVPKNDSIFQQQAKLEWESRIRQELKSNINLQ